jgi:hypothetical protein
MRCVVVAGVATRSGLKRELHELDPRVRSLRVIDEDREDEKVTVNLLDRRHRVVMSLDMWQQEDGSWTAQQWNQCID